MPMTEQLINNMTAKDDEAKAMYRRLLLKWSNRENPQNDDPSNDCLAIARSMKQSAPHQEYH